MAGIIDSSDESPSRWTFQNKFTAATFIMSAAAIVFGLGTNRERVTAQGARIDAVERIYLRADVYAADRAAFREALDRLNRTLEKLEAERPRSSREDRNPPGRQFDK